MCSDRQLETSESSPDSAEPTSVESPVPPRLWAKTHRALRIGFSFLFIGTLAAALLTPKLTHSPPLRSFAQDGDDIIVEIADGRALARTALGDPRLEKLRSTAALAAITASMGLVLDTDLRATIATLDEDDADPGLTPWDARLLLDGAWLLAGRTAGDDERTFLGDHPDARSPFPLDTFSLAFRPAAWAARVRLIWLVREACLRRFVLPRIPIAARARVEGSALVIERPDALFELGEAPWRDIGAIEIGRRGDVLYLKSAARTTRLEPHEGPASSLPLDRAPLTVELGSSARRSLARRVSRDLPDSISDVAGALLDVAATSPMTLEFDPQSERFLRMAVISEGPPTSAHLAIPNVRNGFMAGSFATPIAEIAATLLDSLAAAAHAEGMDGDPLRPRTQRAALEDGVLGLLRTAAPRGTTIEVAIAPAPATTALETTLGAEVVGRSAVDLLAEFADSYEHASSIFAAIERLDSRSARFDLDAAWSASGTPLIVARAPRDDRLEITWPAGTAETDAVTTERRVDGFASIVIDVVRLDEELSTHRNAVITRESTVPAALIRDQRRRIADDLAYALRGEPKTDASFTAIVDERVELWRRAASSRRADEAARRIDFALAVVGAAATPRVLVDVTRPGGALLIAEIAAAFP